MKDRDSYRKEGKQRCRKTPVHTPVHTKTCTRSQRKQSEHVAPVVSFFISDRQRGRWDILNEFA